MFVSHKIPPNTFPPTFDNSTTAHCSQFDKALAAAQEYKDRVVAGTTKPDEDKKIKITTYKTVGGVSMTADDKRQRQSELLLNFIKARKKAFDITKISPIDTSPRMIL